MKDERYCIRCGMTQKDVYRYGEGGYCTVYGTKFGNHSYITDRELEKYLKDNGLMDKIEGMVKDEG